MVTKIVCEKENKVNAKQRKKKQNVTAINVLINNLYSQVSVYLENNTNFSTF